MRSLNRWSVEYLVTGLGLAILAVGTMALPLAAQDEAPTHQAAATKAAATKAAATTVQAEVQKAEQELARINELYQAGVVPATSVDESRIKAAEARIRLATRQQQREVILQEAKSIVTDREHLVALADARYKAGIATASEFNTARIALAEARIRLDLYSLVALHEENLAMVTARFQQGVATQAEVEDATSTLTEARSRLARDIKGD